MVHEDEIHQSLERAHYLNFKDQLTEPLFQPWEYQTEDPIRSFVYISIFQNVERVLIALQLDSAYNILVTFYLTQALINFVGDYFQFQLGILMMNQEAAFYGVIFSTFNYSSLLIRPRTFSQGLDTTLLLGATYYFIQVNQNFDKFAKAFALFITLEFIIRMDSIGHWPMALLIAAIFQKKLLTLIKAAALVSVPIFLASCLIDSIHYGKFCVVQYNNFLFNILLNKSADFGVQPHNYYLDFLINSSPFFLISLLYSIPIFLWNQIRKRQVPYVLIISLNSFGIFSYVQHKEQRFILPAVCLSCSVIGYVFYLHTKFLPKTLIYIIITLISVGELCKFKQFYQELPPINCKDIFDYFSLKYQPFNVGIEIPIHCPFGIMFHDQINPKSVTRNTLTFPTYQIAFCGPSERQRSEHRPILKWKMDNFYSLKRSKDNICIFQLIDRQKQKENFKKLIKFYLQDNSQ